VLRTLPGPDPLRPAPTLPAAAALSPDGTALVVSCPSRRRTPRPPGGGRAAGAAAAHPPGALAAQAAPAAGGAATAAPAAAVVAAADEGYTGDGAGTSCLMVFDLEELEPRVCIETREAGFSRCARAGRVAQNAKLLGQA
jgi:hypothetical protein